MSIPLAYLFRTENTRLPKAEGNVLSHSHENYVITSIWFSDKSHLCVIFLSDINRKQLLIEQLEIAGPVWNSKLRGLMCIVVEICISRYCINLQEEWSDKPLILTYGLIQIYNSNNIRIYNQHSVRQYIVAICYSRQSDSSFQFSLTFRGTKRYKWPRSYSFFSTINRLEYFIHHNQSERILNIIQCIILLSQPFKSKWLLYVPPGLTLEGQMLTLHTFLFNIRKFCVPLAEICLWFLSFSSEQTAIISV